MEVVVKNFSKIVEVTPTISTSAYTAADQIGGIQTLSNAVLSDPEARGGVLQTIVIVDKAKQKSAIDIFFFKELPTVASSDNAAADITDAEMASKCIGVISVVAGDYADLANNSTASVENVGLVLRSTPNADLATANSVYAVAVSRGTPTYGSTSDLVFKYGLLQD